MERPLSPETLAEIDALIERIWVGGPVDAEIREELRSHIQDKIHAYLAGDEEPCEADALLLAKAHFGSPAVIASLFAGVHREPRRRRLSGRGRLVALTLCGVVLVAAAVVLSQWMTGGITLRRDRAETVELPADWNLVPVSGQMFREGHGVRAGTSEEKIPRGAVKYRFNGRTYYIEPLRS